MRFTPRVSTRPSARWHALLAVLLAGCPASGECEFDDECGAGQVCGRDHACSLESDVRSVRTTWTINGQTANTTVCADSELFIVFRGFDRDDKVQFQPVPCFIGMFLVDKLPIRFDEVELGVQNGDSDIMSFDANGEAAFDLAI